MRRFSVKSEDVGLRADIFITRKYPDFTRSSLELLFDKDLIKINNKPIKPSYKVRVGDKLAVDDALMNEVPESIELPILYEDDDVVVINKPAGVLSHSKGVLNPEATVASFILPKLTDMTGNRAGIVHRLDRHTSGVMIAAKNPAALTWLQKQFSGRRTKKTYLAVVEGVPEPAEAIIDAPIARNPKKPQTFHVHSGGKASQTQYKVLRSFQKGQKQYSLVELKPLTGRTHQIRIHMAYINHPVVGDSVYSQAGPHLLLHAKSLELTLPNRSRQTFSAEPPAYLTDFEKQ